jgi:hypothetical protein
MSISILRDPETAIWLLTGVGHVTAQDCLVAAAAARPAAECDDRILILWDVRQALETEPSPQLLMEAEKVVSEFQPHRESRRTALVADSRAWIRMGRLFQEVAEKYSFDFDVFEEVEDAREWLLRPEDPREPVHE